MSATSDPGATSADTLRSRWRSCSRGPPLMETPMLRKHSIAPPDTAAPTGSGTGTAAISQSGPGGAGAVAMDPGE